MIGSIMTSSDEDGENDKPNQESPNKYRYNEEQFGSGNPLGSENTEALANISDFFLQVQEKVETERQNVEKKRQKIDADRQAVKNLAETVEKRYEEIDTRLNELDEIEDDIKNKSEKFDEIYEDSRELRYELKQLRSETEDLKETASNLVKREAGASIGSEFAARRDELKKTLVWWKRATIGSILFLLGASLAIYYDITHSSAQNMTVISKMTLLLPISVAVWFTAAHYNQQRKLIEIYEFKANIALSLMGFREVLREELPEDERDKIGQFVVETMDKIYTDPLDTVSNSEKGQDGGPMSENQMISMMRKFGRN